MKNIKNFEEFNEGVLTTISTIVLSGIFLYKFLKFLVKKLVNKYQRELIMQLMNRIKLLSVGKSMNKINQKFEDALSVYEFPDRFVLRSNSSMFSLEDDVKILKNPKILIYKENKIDLTEDDYETFINIIKKKL